ncbi:MAG: hypothetical protein BWZ08_02794 [candidate division BRC1 bacterium ADurb.BinA292]|nr:MAG: hypothetical protein BWZ08_02794 [candidate division BRC1 bacterium ADurb.BinA292]
MRRCRPRRQKRRRDRRGQRRMRCGRRSRPAWGRKRHADRHPGAGFLRRRTSARGGRRGEVPLAAVHPGDFGKGRRTDQRRIAAGRHGNHRRRRCPGPFVRSRTDRAGEGIPRRERPLPNQRPPGIRRRRCRETGALDGGHRRRSHCRRDHRRHAPGPRSGLRQTAGRRSRPREAGVLRSARSRSGRAGRLLTAVRLLRRLPGLRPLRADLPGAGDCPSRAGGWRIRICGP